MDTEKNIKSPRQNKKKIIGNFIFFLVMVIVVLIVIFSLNDIQKVLEVLKTSNLWFILLAALIAMVHMFSTNFALHFITTGLGSKLKFSKSINIANSEYLFNAITPFSSGGQPVQAYFYMQNGLTGDEAVSTLTSNFVIYQVVLTIFSTVGLIIFYKDVQNSLQNLTFIIIIGYIINTLILIGLILVSTVPYFKNFLRGIFKLLGKIKWIQNPMKRLEDRTFKFVEDYQREVKKLFTRKRVLIGASLLRLLGLFALNSIPAVLFMSFGIKISVYEFFMITMMTAFASCFLMWIPTPGASGGIEWAFTVLFGTFIASKVSTEGTPIIIAALLLWRFLTYYLGILSGMSSYIYLNKTRKPEKEYEAL